MTDNFLHIARRERDRRINARAQMNAQGNLAQAGALQCEGWNHLCAWMEDKTAIDPDWTAFAQLTRVAARRAMLAHVVDMTCPEKAARVDDLTRLARQISIQALMNGVDDAVTAFCQALDFTDPQPGQPQP